MSTKQTVNRHIILSTILIGAAITLSGCQPQPQPQPQEPAAEESGSADPHVMAASTVEAGRYLAIIGGCNDCHTAGYLATNGNIPEEEWFTGSIVGWRGPWGTTYASNLRLRASEMTADDWVDVVHYRTDLPPMPWMNVNQMSEADARAIYEYLASLGPKGEHMPGAIPPGEEPTTPYISLAPLNMEAMPGQ